MIRSRYLGPDSTQVCVGGREVPVVSRQAIVDAAVEAIIALDLTGGYISIAVGRRDTGFPNEKVTHEAVVTFQDRGAAAPQPEEIIDFSGAIVIDEGREEAPQEMAADEPESGAADEAPQPSGA